MEGWTHIRRNLAQILGDEPVRAGLLEKNTEEHFALTMVVVAVLGRAVVARQKTRQRSTSDFLSLLGREKGEAIVLLRTPWKIPDSKKPQRMVDAKQVENLARGP